MSGRGPLLRALKVGQVLSISEFYTPHLAELVGGYPLHAIVTQEYATSNLYVTIDFCASPMAKVYTSSTYRNWHINGRDVFEVLDESEYPDVVLGWLAQRAML